jgi:hypothetical protein
LTLCTVTFGFPNSKKKLYEEILLFFYLLPTVFPRIVSSLE